MYLFLFQGNFFYKFIHKIKILFLSDPYKSWFEMQDKLDEFLAPYPKLPEIPLETFKVFFILIITKK